MATHRSLFKRASRWGGALVMSAGLSMGHVQAADQTLLNSSYDIARELFSAYNELFAEQWEKETGKTVEVRQSHAGSSRQAQAIIQGLRADVVTYNQVTDVDILHERGNLIPEDWRDRLPNASSPYYSTMAFLVRKGNPKNIQNWDDLTREDVSSVLPNPKTSGNGRYTYLAALGYAQKTYGDDQAAIDNFLRTFLGNVAVFDTGGRGATTTFVERGIGDVLLTFESEVNNIAAQNDGYEVVVPKISFLAEFPVTWIDKSVKHNGTEGLAKAYLEGLYSEDAQRLIAGFYNRVHNEKVKAEFADQFPEVELLPVEEIGGSWENVMKEHFASGGKLDQLQRR
ncbi:thiosulfate ABC transporter substrate-binding protein CysP [Halopseudomonas bauzanensis]|uniref:Sulfate transport system substrate-binding protein n=1 Tax=Halopseudomonas bauzanensis TaxID=653930 RepID=A0A1H9N7R9_9GAMM|nr:thiosulfate ABC transporter substrate-binding protein CysP [Halopseudomonas bauzanensis]SER31709.1 sulfate transport system substrate-binding protein [Halopseudomonas bauzanensis]SFL83359.1 sulfate transport system substrate-binding protein [Halopseudomonas bauzanensis]